MWSIQNLSLVHLDSTWHGQTWVKGRAQDGEKIRKDKEEGKDRGKEREGGRGEGGREHRVFTHTQMFPVKVICGHRWGLHMTATTAIPEAVLTGLAFSLGKRAFLWAGGTAAMMSTSLG